jgi:predicted nuclease of predicted toxin-antitoxin system
MNVDHEVTQFLAEQGHTTLLVRDELGEGTPDAAIVAYALREYGIVVTRNHHDFYPHAKQALDSGRRDHQSLGSTEPLLQRRCGGSPREATV